MVGIPYGFVFNGSAVIASNGTAVIGVAQETGTFTAPETHFHDQPHRQPLEAVEGLTMIPVTLTCAGIAAVRFRYHKHLDGSLVDEPRAEEPSEWGSGDGLISGLRPRDPCSAPRPNHDPNAYKLR